MSRLLSSRVVDGPRGRVLALLLLLCVSAACFARPLAALARLCWTDERYTYIAAVPFLSAVLLWLRRAPILDRARSSPLSGTALLALTGAAALWALPRPDASVAVLAIALFWISGFVLIFGWRSLLAASFPVLLLLAMTPLPASWMDRLEVSLQFASADATAVLFRFTSMPVFRNGLTFSLPGVDVEVAKECSGIRSSTVFWVTTAVAGYLFLRSGWSRFFLLCLSVPVVVFKNALRITVISWLGVNVSPSFLTGNLHRQGGLPFTLVAVALMVPLVFALQRIERRPRRLAASR